MKILHVSTFDRGGAAIAAIRLHEGLLREGVQSRILFLDRSDVHIRESISFKKQRLNNLSFVQLIKRRLSNKHNLVLKKRDQAYEGYTLHWGYDISKIVNEEECDIINLHWVSGFLDYESFFSGINIPVVWTLHDMNAFTGGCHYSWHCDKFKATCKHCFQLSQTDNDNISEYTLKAKLDALHHYRQSISIVSPSHWLTKCAKESTLFKGLMHHTIPYGISIDQFPFFEKKKSRALLGLPEDATIFLFVSQITGNKRKGLSVLIEALSRMKTTKRITFLTMGEKCDLVFDKLNVIELGTLKDTRTINLYYAASTAYLIPSLQDNLPNTVIESLVSGTPVIGFPVGGILDMIEPQINGLISTDRTAQGLAEVMDVMVDNQDLFNEDHIRKDAIRRYALSVQALRYEALYNKIMLGSSQ